MIRTKSALLDMSGAAEDAEGTFTGYAAVFDVVDSDSDVIRKGAFAESIAEYGPTGAGIACYWNHRLDDPDMNIGITVEAREDAHGLFVKVQLDLDSPKGAQVYKLIKQRRVRQMSFAYDVLGYSWIYIGDREVLELHKLRIHEVSVVPVGANQATELLTVKSAPADEGRQVAAAAAAFAEAILGSIQRDPAPTPVAADHDPEAPAEAPIEVQADPAPEVAEYNHSTDPEQIIARLAVLALSD